MTLLKLIAYALLIIAVKALIFLFYLKGYYSTPVYVLIINPWSAFFLWYYIWIIKRPFAIWSHYAFILDVALPIFGFPIICFYIISYNVSKIFYRRTNVGIYSDIYGSMGKNEEMVHRAILARGPDRRSPNRNLQEALNIEPYVDIFEGKNLKMKINAIEKLSRNRSRESVAILRNALQLPAYEVRYFANIALEKIQDTEMKEIASLSDQIQKNHFDSSLYDRRGDHYQNLVNSRIMDESMKEFWLEKALCDYFLCMQLGDDGKELWKKIARVFLEKKDYSSMILIVNKALATEIDDREKGKLLFYRAEANFYLKKYQDVIHDAQKVSQYNLGFELIDDSVNWWKYAE